jgi:DNA ligase-1
MKHMKPMKPMLAAPSDGNDLKYPVLASPKLDGVRALIINGVVMSRSLKPIPNRYVQSLFGLKKLNGFDGELIVGDSTAKDVYHRTVSAAMKHDGEPPARFFVFDDFDHGCDPGFEKRFTGLYDRVTKLPPLQFDNCFVHNHNFVKDKDQFDLLEASYLAMGFEGIMIRDPNGPYKYGRSTLKEGLLLKVKRFVDSEATILGITQLMHNTNDQIKNELGNSVRSSKKAGKIACSEMGSMKVRDIKTGVEFEIGTGFTDVQRSAFWADRGSMVGKIVKYKSQPTGVKDKPRFPVFLGFRDVIDL